MPSSTSSPDDDIETAGAVLARGGVIGFPTETVYGLGADARSPEAVNRIFRIKGRPADHPLIVHVADLAAAAELSSDWNENARRLAERFWPGPLTLVVHRSPDVIDEVTGGRDTVAIRVPRHALALRLLQEFAGPVAAPSANRFGRVSPTCAQHVRDDLGSDVDFVLDGGSCEVGLESTIVDCTVDPPQVLRPGAITAEQVMAAVGSIAEASGPSRAPGMLESHYAPYCRVVPVDVEDATPRDAERVLDARSDPDRFARDVYALLRECDDQGVDTVAVLLPPDSGIGRAIRDRVFKAAADRRH